MNCTNVGYFISYLCQYSSGSVILFHMIHKVTLNFCCSFFLAIYVLNNYHSELFVLMLVATCGAVMLYWAVWELNICEHLHMRTHAASSGFVFLTNARVLNLGSNKVAMANGSTLTTLTNFLAIPNSRWCHILCTRCSCACSWFCWTDWHIWQWRHNYRYSNICFQVQFQGHNIEWPQPN